MGNWTLGNGTFQNVSGEMGHFYYLGNGTFYALGEGTLYSLGNGKFYPLGTILSSGNRTTYPEIRDILWEMGYGKRDTLSSGNRTTYPLGIGKFYLLGIGKRGIGFLPSRVLRGSHDSHFKLISFFKIKYWILSQFLGMELLYESLWPHVCMSASHTFLNLGFLQFHFKSAKIYILLKYVHNKYEIFYIKKEEFFVFKFFKGRLCFYIKFYFLQFILYLSKCTFIFICDVNRCTWIFRCFAYINHRNKGGII